MPGWCPVASRRAYASERDFEIRKSLSSFSYPGIPTWAFFHDFTKIRRQKARLTIASSPKFFFQTLRGVPKQRGNNEGSLILDSLGKLRKREKRLRMVKEPNQSQQTRPNQRSQKRKLKRRSRRSGNNFLHSGKVFGLKLKKKRAVVCHSSIMCKSYYWDIQKCNHGLNQRLQPTNCSQIAVILRIPGWHNPARTHTC